MRQSAPHLGHAGASRNESRIPRIPELYLQGLYSGANTTSTHIYIYIPIVATVAARGNAPS